MPQLYDAQLSSKALQKTLAETMQMYDVLLTGIPHYLTVLLTDSLQLYDALTVGHFGVITAILLKEVLVIAEICSVIYYEGCINYDYLVSVFNMLTQLASGKSIARELERKDP
jgi:hypothetical protein